MTKTKFLEVAPPGWEGTVKKMKSHPEIDNPFALAWWMADQGYSQEAGAKKPINDSDLLREWSALKGSGKLEAYANRKESAGIKLGLLSRFLEGEVSDSTREVPVVIITEGLGNSRDKHFYSKECLVRAVEEKIFEGAQCYMDHPSVIEESSRPERSVRDLVGYYKDVRLSESQGRTAVVAKLKICEGDSYNWCWDLVKESVTYAKQYPGKDLAGISINASGVVEKTKEANIVKRLDSAFSADIVTRPARGGRLVLMESVRKIIKESEGGQMKDKIKSACEALGKLKDAQGNTPEVTSAIDEVLSLLMDAGNGMDEADMKAKADMEKANADKLAAEKKAEDASKDPQAGMEADKVLASAVTDHAAGTMRVRERALYEAMLTAQKDKKLLESSIVLEKKLAESELPEVACEDLRKSLVGAEEAKIAEAIAGRKKLIESLQDGNFKGVGPKTLHAGKSGEDLIREAGLPVKVKEGK